MATKFTSNVTHNGILFKAGDIIAGVLDGVHEGLVKRGLVVDTQEAPTHRSDEGDVSGRALPLDPAKTPAEPTQAEIEATNAAREAELRRVQEDQARAAESQVQSAQPGQPTQAEIEAATAGIQ